MGIRHLDTIDVVSSRNLLLFYERDTTAEPDHNPCGLYRHSGEPNNFVAAEVGSLCMGLDGTFWQKTGGGGSTIGWTQFGGIGVDRNFAEQNLTADGARTHEWAGNTFTMNGVDSWTQRVTNTTLMETDSLVIDAPSGTILAGDTSASARLFFRESTTGGTRSVTLRAPTTLSQGSYQLVLPINDGNSGDVLSTDGNGNLAWAGGVGDTSITAGNLATATADRTANFGDNSLTFSNMSTATMISDGDFTIQSAIEFVNIAGQALVISDITNAAVGGAVRYKESLSQGAVNYVELRGPGSMASNVNLTLPATMPPGAEKLALGASSDGILEWIPAGTGNDRYRGSFLDIGTLNDAADPNDPSGTFLNDRPAEEGDFAVLTNGGNPTTWAAYDPEGADDAKFFEIDPANPVVNLSIGARDGVSMAIDNDSGTGVVLTQSTATLAGLITNVQHNKLEAIDAKQMLYGDGVLTSYPFLHNMGTKYLSVTVREAGGDERQVFPRVEFDSDSQISLHHAQAPSTNTMIVTVQKIPLSN